MIIMEEMEEINNAFKSAKEINVYKEGVKTTYSLGSEEYKKILSSFYETIEGSHEMPAYGVSLNRDTVKALQSGLWTEFVFGKKMECNGMPFEKLLISVGKEHYGFNIIRYTTKFGYDGRCFYLDLVGKNMNNFYDILLKL